MKKFPVHCFEYDFLKKIAMTSKVKLNNSAKCILNHLQNTKENFCYTP